MAVAKKRKPAAKKKRKPAEKTCVIRKSKDKKRNAGAKKTGCWFRDDKFLFINLKLI